MRSTLVKKDTFLLILQLLASLVCICLPLNLRQIIRDARFDNLRDALRQSP